MLCETRTWTFVRKIHIFWYLNIIARYFSCIHNSNIIFLFCWVEFKKITSTLLYRYGAFMNECKNQREWTMTYQLLAPRTMAISWAWENVPKLSQSTYFMRAWFRLYSMELCQLIEPFSDASKKGHRVYVTKCLIRPDPSSSHDGIMSTVSGLLNFAWVFPLNKIIDMNSVYTTPTWLLKVFKIPP